MERPGPRYRRLSTTLAILAAWLVAPAAAEAATITVTVSGTAPNRTLALQLDGSTGAGITSAGSDLTISGRVGDTVNAPGCTPTTGETVDCGPPGQYANFSFQGSDGADRLFVTSSLPQRVEAHGGGGDDDLTSGAGPDVLHGDAGDDSLNGEGGDDELLGGADDDEIFGMAGADRVDGGTGADQMFGGHDPGDTLDYSSTSLRAPATA